MILFKKILILLAIFSLSTTTVLGGITPAREFDGFGVIDQISDGEVVLNDNVLKLAGNVEYFTLTGESTLKSYFKKGVEVAYVLDSEGTVISLWLWK